MIINNLPLPANQAMNGQEQTDHAFYKSLHKKLFNLLGLYGNVIRIKILFKNRRNALIEFQNPEQAQKCKHHLNKIPFYGQELKINESNQQEIQTTGPSENGSALLFSDFKNSLEHRFRK